MKTEHWAAKAGHLTSVLVARICAGDEGVPLSKFQDMDIPEIVRGHAILRAQKLFENASPLRVENSGRIDLNNADVQRQLQTLKACLLRETLLTKSEIDEIVTWAVTFQLHILVRPRQKLLEVLFRNNATVNRETVETVLHGFGDERAVVRKMIAALDDLKTEAIEEESFSALVRLAEQEVFKQTPVTAFMTDVKLLLEFESEIAGMPKKQLSSFDVSGLLRERGLDVARLQVQQELQDKEGWTPEEIEDSLARHLLLEGFEAATRKQPRRYFAPRRPRKAKPGRSIAADNQTALFDFGDEEPRAASATEQLSPLIETNESPPGNGSAHSATTELLAEPSESQHPPGTNDHSSEEHVIVQTVFYDNEQEYKAFVARLEETSDWKAARVVMEQELLVRNVSPFSQAAALMVEFVSARFEKDDCA